ncbi:MAG: translation initiation factor IF-2, partial [Clostridia bacterium]|nr:translation initiation factor IF-2 [Clostridia bacterium]
MANVTKNQEFNKAIKQLQSMVNEKQIISLAEKYYNLKVEMSSLTRAVKEKENALILEEAKSLAAKPEPKVEQKAEEKTAVVFAEPKVEEKRPSAQQQKPTFANRQNDRPQRQNQQGQFNPNYRNERNQNAQNRNFNQQRPFNPNYKPGQNNQRPNGQQRPFNPNFKPGQNNQRPMANKDGLNKRPAINYAQPIITASPTRTFANKKKENERFEEKRQYSKRDLLKRGMIVDGDEDRVINRKVKTKKKETEVREVVRPQGPAVITTDNITIKLLSEVSGKPVSEIIKKFMILGMMVTINSTIDFATAELILSDMGIELVQKLDKTSEEKLEDLQKDLRSYSDEDAVVRPPIVTVMGHVDHGKTSLLDYIKKSKVAAGEAGGITQAIGAYRVKVNDDYITFVDTPGHEAFTAMRARGASVTDIAILIVAADDGIMPQTVEAINHIKSANIPMIVAINKIDKPQAEPDKILSQLAEHNVLPEAWGGDAIICKVSAKTGEGIDKLLETILLVADVQGLKANPDIPAMGTIMEARLDKGRGPIASLIIRDGSLKVGDTIVSGTTICKVKAMIDENNKQVKVATPSMPVTVLGFNEVPPAGETFTAVDEKLSKQIVEERKAKIKEDLIKGSGGNT